MNTDALGRPVAIDDTVMLTVSGFSNEFMTIGKITNIQNTDIFVTACDTGYTVRKDSNQIVVVTTQIKVNHKNYPEFYI